MTNPDSILKSRDITLPTKVCLVKTMLFCWTIKKAEHWRIDAFELWCWRRLFLFTNKYLYLYMYLASQVALVVKNWPTVQDMWVLSLSWEEHLEWAMTTHSSIVAWKIPWTKEPAGAQFMWSQRVKHDWVYTNTMHTYIDHFWGPSFLLGDVYFPLALFIFWQKNLLFLVVKSGVEEFFGFWISESLLHISFGRYFLGVLKSRCTIFF